MDSFVKELFFDTDIEKLLMDGIVQADDCLGYGVTISAERGERITAKCDEHGNGYTTSIGVTADKWRAPPLLVDGTDYFKVSGFCFHNRKAHGVRCAINQ